MFARHLNVTKGLVPASGERGRETPAGRVAYPKFALDAGERRDLLDDYLPFCETVPVPDPPPAVPECRDPSDRPFLELALAGRADALVTGDADLLTLADVFPVPILPPADFRRRLSHGEEAER